MISISPMICLPQITPYYKMSSVVTGQKILVFLDTNVATSWPGLEHNIGEWFDIHPRCGLLVSPLILVPGGERCKNDFEYPKVIARNMRITGLDRHSYVIIIGGGAVLDAVGFITSITHRWIRHIRMPTTVLSQNDSGIGIKNGVNLYRAKNYFGTFTPPYSVIMEILTNHKLLYSEAVAISIVLDMTIALNRGLINKEEYELVCQGLRNCGFSLWHPVLEKKEENNFLHIYNGLDEFRQHLGGELTSEDASKQI